MKPRPLIDNQDGTHTVILTRGLVSIIDSADANLISGWCWCAMGKASALYAARKCTTTNRVLWLHRVIMGVGVEGQLEHINADRLDNRRSNLRPCSRSSWRKSPMCYCGKRRIRDGRALCGVCTPTSERRKRPRLHPRKPRPVRPIQDLGWGLCLVELTKGEVAIIDAADAERVGQFNWVSHERIYAYRTELVNGRSKKIYLHRFILGVPPELEVDHINNKTWDNTRSNLRPATKSENQHNKRKGASNTSGHKGVCYDKQTGKWMAYVSRDYKPYNLGRFDSVAEAAEVYRRAAAQLHGDFARFA